MKAYCSMINGMLPRALLQTTALVGLTTLTVGALPASAQVCDATVIPLPAGCLAQNAGRAVSVPVQANTELLRHVPVGGFGAQGFSISLDNRTIAGAPAITVPQRTSDLRNTAADIDVRFDGLDTRRHLNVGVTEGRTAFRAGETITFRSYTNYPGYIDRAEIQIRDRNRIGSPVIAQVPITANSTAEFVMPSQGGDELAYSLRVYDADGRFDETRPLPLARTDILPTDDTTGASPLPTIGEGEDNTGRRGIPVRGGVITTSGTAAPGSTVSVMGEPVAVDPSGHFAVSRVVPPGDQIVTVNVNGRTYVRDVEIPRSEWFYVGLADLTVGAREGGPQSRSWEGYTNGRLAFYAKGTTENGWSITSSADTRNGPLDEMFSRLNDKDPRRVLDRIRSDGTDLFPTYGDDSSYYDDTPTSGAIYLRAENDNTRFTLGDFKTGIAGPGLINNARDLYGVELQYQSSDVTSHGDARVSAMAYAAQLETAAQRDILRGTGGSVYFLTRQDITGGSATVTVQVLDPDTGFVSSNRLLTEGVDYRVDHMQGVIILAGPLTSSTGDGGLINTGVDSDNVNLVVQYEYTPTEGLSDANAVGGRAEVWVTDDLRIGGSVMSENTPSGTDQRIGSVDLRYRLGETSYAELEVARTEGPGFTRSISQDGGLTIASSGGAGAHGSQALRFTSLLDLRELGLERDGSIGLRYESKDAGFSTLNEDITDDQTLFGLQANVDINDRIAVAFETEHFTSDSGKEKTETEGAIAYRLTNEWTAQVGVQFTDKATPSDVTETGTRTDLGLKLSYAPTDDFLVYVFGQATVNTGGGLSDNNRLGVGTDMQITERMSVAAEISNGDTGVAGKLQLGYAASANNEVYLGYTLDPTRAGAGDALADNGRVVLGGRFRYSETLSSYAENIYDMPGNQRSLTQAYGVTYTSTESLTYSLGMETGTIRDSVSGDFDRVAFSFGAAYVRDEDFSIRGRLEYRTEDGEGTSRDRDTIGLTAGFSNKVARDWRFLANVDALYSDSATGDFRDGEYLRASFGYAYRPIDNERLNLLLRLTALNDLPSEDQVDANGNTEGPQQRSAVFAVAGSYDLNRHLTLGGKLAHRVSEIADRGTDDFTANTASLAILRADWHVVDNWDIMAEGRVSFTSESDIAETGALLGVYRHVNKNVKLGVGYEWGGVSANETDLNYEGQGVFLNLVGKF